MTTKSKNVRLDRSTKLGRKLSRIEPGIGHYSSKQLFTVEVTAERVPEEIMGFLIEQNEHHVVFRHKKSSGSSAVRNSIYPTSDVVEVFGKVGETSSLRIMTSKEICKMTGYVQRTGGSGVIKVKDATTGEVSSFYPTEGVKIKVYAEDVKPTANKKRSVTSGARKRTATSSSGTRKVGRRR